MEKSVQKALKEYSKYSDLNQDYIVVVDYTKPSSQRRLYVVDLKTNKIVRRHHVAHGTKSSCRNIAYACSFSNKWGSHKSSLGAMKTGKIYYGKYGKSLKLHGLEKGVNSAVYSRFIVVHPSNYVTDAFINKHGYAGRSWGCLAVDPAISSSLIDLIKDGTFVYSYF